MAERKDMQRVLMMEIDWVELTELCLEQLTEPMKGTGLVYSLAE